jgi:dolichol-phosphate mannosyltransferase
MKTTLIICAKNEEATLASVIKKANKYVDEVLVIDGHSNDKSRQIARNLGCKVFLDNGKGKGAAVRLGIKKAKGEIIVFIDADGSHESKDIPKLIKTIRERKADLVIASRGKGGSDELHGDFEKLIRLIGSTIITLVINQRFGIKLTDSQNGFRAIKREAAQSLDLKENITTIEQEMIIKALKKGYRICEIPGHEYARKKGKSHINLLTMGPRYVWCLAKNII